MKTNNIAFNFLSPSYKRADLCLTHKSFPSVTYIVSKSEAKEYKKNGLNVIEVDDNIQGNNARVRNWILDNYNDIPLVMIDDDILSIGFYSNGKRIKLNEEQLFQFIDNHINMMNDVGLKLGGINLILEPRAYRYNKPFSFTTPILGPFNIHLKSKIRYSEELNLKADYDYFLEHIKEFKGALRDNRINYDHKRSNYKGGCSALRTTDEEKRQFALFQAKWGKKIVKEQKNGAKDFDINPIIKL